MNKGQKWKLLNKLVSKMLKLNTKSRLEHLALI